MSSNFTDARAPARGEIGRELRAWRLRRRLSQLELSLAANISQRHLSFLESGRANPSRGMVLQLAKELDVPLRDRNELLLAAGFAPVYSDRDLADPGSAAGAQLLDTILRAHAPHPALAIDRHWQMVSANAAVAPLLEGVKELSLLRPPVNVLRLTLHPGGLAPRIANLGEWRSHLLDRLRREIRITDDPALVELAREFSGEHPASAFEALKLSAHDRHIAVPLVLNSSVGRLSLISTTTVFGTPSAVILSEIAIEAFYPLDEMTAARMRALLVNSQPVPGHLDAPFGMR
jgi:transcriptional regulator with XRE-family HTH domain